MRTRLIVCAMSVALVAIAAVGAASATAKEVVFEVDGTPLPPGTQLEGTSLNVEVQDYRGGSGCDGRFEGEILAEPGTFEIYEDTFFYPDKEAKPGCFLSYSINFPTSLSLVFAEPVTLEANEGGEISGSTPGTIEWGSCDYEATFQSSAHELEGGGQTYLHISGGEFVEECLGGVEFKADFRLSANGEPVTVDVI